MNFTKFNLKPGFFDRHPQVLAENGIFKATAFKYSTGVCGLHIENERCRITILPFQGQQVWRMEVDGRDYTMVSVFDEPQPTDRFGLNYGAFLLHCGLTAMGNPSAEDTHPLHGELPNALYFNAYTGMGEDEKGQYIVVGGTYTYRNSQEFYYNFKPELRLYSGKTVVEMTAVVENLRCNPMNYMYMCHINWVPVNGSRIVYSAPKDAKHIEVFRQEFSEPSENNRKLAGFIETLAENPEVGDIVDPETQYYNPELCSCMKYAADVEGYAHAMQVMPRGDACYVAFHTEELPNGLRWVSRTGDEDAFGFALPTTGNHLGYTYAKRHGLLRQITPHGSLTMHCRFGYLSGEEAFKIEQHINDILCS